jgi:hypothetical protein
MEADEWPIDPRLEEWKLMIGIHTFHIPVPAQLPLSEKGIYGGFKESDLFGTTIISFDPPRTLL